MNRTRSRIVRLLVRSGPATCAEICAELQVSSSVVRRHLYLMRDEGLVQNQSHRFSARPRQIRERLLEAALTFEVQVMPKEPSAAMDEGKLEIPFLRNATTKGSSEPA
ncbi:ArsR family transcriptional regulator [Arthrobacter sp. NA-172]|uniref:ArsR family transcriptional regulator n=1 Tax=Arthrobacter sp. NA-172 TaxID=3367524 RepID=UPI00375532FD